jgi:hypothetical protein
MNKVRSNEIGSSDRSNTCILSHSSMANKKDNNNDTMIHYGIDTILTYLTDTNKTNVPTM